MLPNCYSTRNCTSPSPVRISPSLTLFLPGPRKTGLKVPAQERDAFGLEIPEGFFTPSPAPDKTSLPLNTFLTGTQMQGSNRDNAERVGVTSGASEIAAAALAVAAAVADTTISVEESMDLDSGPGGLICFASLLFWGVLGLETGYDADYNALPFLTFSLSIYTANTTFPMQGLNPTFRIPPLYPAFIPAPHSDRPCPPLLMLCFPLLLAVLLLSVPAPRPHSSSR